MSSSSSALKPVERHGEIEHHDPMEAISNHVIIIVFIALFFLASVFVFMASVPSESHATAYAIVDYNSVMPEFKFFDNVGDVIDKARNSNDQPYLLLTMFVGWIMVVGLINIVLHERHLNKEEELRKK